MARTNLFNLLAFFAVTFALVGCDTSRRVLQLELSQLREIERSQSLVAEDAANGVFDRRRYDVHLFLNSDVFESVLAQIGGVTFVPDEAPQITVSIDPPELEFRPGYPQIEISAKAEHSGLGVQGDLTLAASLVLLDGEPKRLKAVVTDVEPNLRWRFFDLRYVEFIRQLAKIEVIEYSKQIPAVDLPAGTEFEFGGSPFRDSITAQAGGSTIVGTVTAPGVGVKGRIVVEELLFLSNGVHLYANVEAR